MIFMASGRTHDENDDASDDFLAFLSSVKRKLAGMGIPLSDAEGERHDGSSSKEVAVSVSDSAADSKSSFDRDSGDAMYKGTYKEEGKSSERNLGSK